MTDGKPAVVTYDDVKLFVASWDITAGDGYFLNKMLYIMLYIF